MPTPGNTISTNPANPLRTSMTPPTTSPLLKRVYANAIDKMVPMMGILLKTLANGLINFINILPIDPPPIFPNAFPAILDIPPNKNLPTFANPSPKNLPILPKNCKGVFNILPAISKNGLMALVKSFIPPFIPNLDNIFKIPLNGPFVINPVTNAANPPANNSKPPNIPPSPNLPPSLFLVGMGGGVTCFLTIWETLVFSFSSTFIFF